MRIITTRQSTVIGLLGAFGAIIMMVIVYLFRETKMNMVIIGASGSIYMLFLAYFGLFRSHLSFDQAYLIRRRGKSFERHLISDIESVRTMPIFRSMGIVWIKLSSGASFHTVVLDQDLTWIMSRVPNHAITPYWRRKCSTNTMRTRS